MDNGFHSIDFPKGWQRLTDAILVLLGKRRVLRPATHWELLSNPQSLEDFAKSRPWKHNNLPLVQQLAVGLIRTSHPEWIKKEEN